MVEYLIQYETLTAIANAIRDKKGYPPTITMSPEQMADEIETISTSSGEIVQPEQTITPSKETQTVPSENSGYTAVRKVTVNAIPDDYIIPMDNLEIIANSEDPIDVKKYATVTVIVPTDIPLGYHYTGNVTATESDVVSGIKFVDAEGNEKTGSINTNDTYQTIVLTSTNTSFNLSGTYYRRGGHVYVNVFNGTETNDINISDI